MCRSTILTTATTTTIISLHHSHLPLHELCLYIPRLSRTRPSLWWITSTRHRVSMRHTWSTKVISSSIISSMRHLSISNISPSIWWVRGTFDNNFFSKLSSSGFVSNKIVKADLRRLCYSFVIGGWTEKHDWQAGADIEGKCHHWPSASVLRSAWTEIRAKLELWQLGNI